MHCAFAAEPFAHLIQRVNPAICVDFDFELILKSKGSFPPELYEIPAFDDIFYEYYWT